uniref:Aquaporin 10b n=1 Tax=Neogobius melanostomus TaxID=47308 RepID=A0A8C6SF34_9GOBI
CQKMERILRKCRIQNQLVRECLAECLGVYILILFGCGSVAQVTTTRNQKGEYLSINLGFALGVTLGVYVSRGVSGAHLNPAVSLSLCALGRHSWFKLPFYIFFQLLGAFLAAATVALQYYEAIQSYSGGELTVSGPNATAGIFCTFPDEYLSLLGGFIDQVRKIGLRIVEVILKALLHKLIFKNSNCVCYTVPFVCPILSGPEEGGGGCPSWLRVSGRCWGLWSMSS